MALLTKAGLPSQRNLSKQYRTQRVDSNGKIHWADNMRLGTHGQAVNSTGCFGMVSTFGVRAKLYGPQKGKRRSAKRKKVCKMPSTREFLLSETKGVEWLISLRSQLLVIQTIGDYANRDFLGEHLQRSLSQISIALRMRLSPREMNNLYRRDEHTLSSLKGRLEKDGIGVVKLRKIKNKVEHALKTL